MEKKRKRAGQQFRLQRIAAAFALLVILFCAGNYYLEWGLFGRFAKGVALLSALAAFIQFKVYGPSIQRLHAYRRLKRIKRATQA